MGFVDCLDLLSRFVFFLLEGAAAGVEVSSTFSDFFGVFAFAADLGVEAPLAAVCFLPNPKGSFCTEEEEEDAGVDTFFGAAKGF